ncbi:MAG: sigma-70 family RNA polymerase sigma factor [Planctomycetes bacterium]|nr:sigma-70 family RNA polymerase sigma factor [Planctomycetota bacterium]
MTFQSNRLIHTGSKVSSSEISSELILRIKREDREALAELFSRYRPRLLRMVQLRLHPKLRGRIDPDDVLQEAWLKAVDRMSYFQREADHSPYIWLRLITTQTMIEMHRRHLGAEKRDAGREMSIHGGWDADSTASSLSFSLQGRLSSPSSAVRKEELAKQIDDVLNSMNNVDREILALRHFEELSNREVSQILNMSEQATSIRYFRALGRLKSLLQLIPDLSNP